MGEFLLGESEVPSVEIAPDEGVSAAVGSCIPIVEAALQGDGGAVVESAVANLMLE